MPTASPAIKSDGKCLAGSKDHRLGDRHHTDIVVTKPCMSDSQMRYSYATIVAGESITIIILASSQHAFATITLMAGSMRIRARTVLPVLA